MKLRCIRCESGDTHDEEHEGQVLDSTFELQQNSDEE